MHGSEHTRAICHYSGLSLFFSLHDHFWVLQKEKQTFRILSDSERAPFYYVHRWSWLLHKYKITLEFITINSRGSIHLNAPRSGGALEHVPGYVTTLHLQISETLNEKSLSLRPISDLRRLTQFS